MLGTVLGIRDMTVRQPRFLTHETSLPRARDQGVRQNNQVITCLAKGQMAEIGHPLEWVSWGGL